MSESNYLEGACVWQGAEMGKSHRWVKDFPPAVLEQIDVAVRKAKEIDWRNVNRQNFPLPGSEAFFDDVREELENGSGMVKIRGLDVDRYDAEQLRSIWYAPRHLGTPMFQNYRGEVMREIKDEGMGVGAKLYGATVDASGKQFLSSGARTLSPGQLRFHTDRCDVVGLLCVRQASEGGVSKLTSSATVGTRPMPCVDPIGMRCCGAIEGLYRSRYSACRMSILRMGIAIAAMSGYLSLTVIAMQPSECALSVASCIRMPAMGNQGVDMHHCAWRHSTPQQPRRVPRSHGIYGRCDHRPGSHAHASSAVHAQPARPAERSRGAVGRRGCRKAARWHRAARRGDKHGLGRVRRISTPSFSAANVVRARRMAPRWRQHGSR